MLYEDELTFVREAPDNMFPDFLFNPVFNDFDDDYYQRSFVTDSLSADIMRLRRRYTDYFEYMNALTIYDEYMEKVIAENGGVRAVKNGIKMGTLDIPIPAKPKLKNTKRNRQYMRSGVVPSEKADVPELSDEEMLAIARRTFPNHMGEDIDESLEHKKLPKDLQKRLHKMTSQIAAKDRRRNMYRSADSNAGTDFIVEYLNQAKRGYYDRSGDYTGGEYASMSLYEIMQEEERIRKTPPELLEEEGNTTTIVNGRLVYRKEQEKIELYKYLFSQGFDVVGKFSRNMNKKALKMIRAEIGDTEPASKKEMKKIRKRTRKEREEIEKRRDANKLFQDTLLGNKFSFTDNGSNLSFKLKDIYRD